MAWLKKGIAYEANLLSFYWMTVQLVGFEQSAKLRIVVNRQKSLKVLAVSPDSHW